MANSELIIDEESLRAMAEYIALNGKKLDELVMNYLFILECVKSSGLVSGSTSLAFNFFLSQANALKGLISPLTTQIQHDVNNFVNDAANADQFNF